MAVAAVASDTQACTKVGVKKRLNGVVLKVFVDILAVSAYCLLHFFG